MSKYIQATVDLVDGHGPFIHPVKPEPPSYPRPIPVSERLPELGWRKEMVLGFNQTTKAWHEGWFDDLLSGPFFVLVEDREQSDANVTHWMPMPPPPTLTSETESD